MLGHKSKNVSLSEVLKVSLFVELVCFCAIQGEDGKPGSSGHDGKPGKEVCTAFNIIIEYNVFNVIIKLYNEIGECFFHLPPHHHHQNQQSCLSNCCSFVFTHISMCSLVNANI